MNLNSKIFKLKNTYRSKDYYTVYKDSVCLVDPEEAEQCELRNVLSSFLDDPVGAIRLGIESLSKTSLNDDVEPADIDDYIMESDPFAKHITGADRLNQYKDMVTYPEKYIDGFSDESHHKTSGNQDLKTAEMQSADRDKNSAESADLTSKNTKTAENSKET